MLKTSFFNKAVFKRNLQGYWPLWAVYLGAMLLIFPVPLYSSLQYDHYYDNAANLARSLFGRALPTSLILGAFFAIFATMAVFSYMYTSRSANMTASLPVSREALFTTNFLTILFVTVSVHVITAAITIIMIAMINIKLLFVLPILQWIILGVLMTLFFICLSCFCATLTGSILILPCIYGVLNFSVILINTLLSAVFADFLYGYSYYSVPEWVMWLTPSVKLLSTATHTYRVAEGTSYIAFNSTGEIILYTVVGIILLAAALFIHKKRRTESASDIIAVNPLKPVVKYFFAGVGSLTLGLLINELFFYYLSGSIIGYAISMIIGGFVGYFASEMLVTKSFKVWHKWKGYLIYCVVVMAFLACLSFDLAGFETTIPRESSIQSVTVEIYGESIEGDDAQTIALATNLHEYIIEHRDDEFNLNEDNTIFYSSVDIFYRLEGGATVQRSYHCILPDFIIAELNSPQRCFDRIAIPEYYSASELVYASLEYYDGESWQIMELTPEQFFDFYNNCIMKDLGSSSLGALDLGKAAIEHPVTLNVEFEDEYYGGYYSYIQIPTDAYYCMNFFENLKLTYTPVH